jgi:ABC-type multidrug transport system fused ATPase/permease subunit
MANSQTIAHRLRTIINYDRIAVMSDGVAVQYVPRF